MKDIFEHAYQGTLNLFSEAVKIVVAFGKVMGVCGVLNYPDLASSLYLIFKKG